MMDQLSSFLVYTWILKQFALQHSRKPVSGYKLKEITGSGIFAPGSENGTEESDANPIPNRRMYQVYGCYAQNSFAVCLALRH